VSRLILGVVAITWLWASIALANVLEMPPGLTSLETVFVGDAGNVGELSGSDAGGYYGPDRICGAVAYDYHIGKYEVTAGQYCEFLNAVAKADTYELYNLNMADPVNSRGCSIQRNGTSGNYMYSVASDYANRPVNYVSYWDACRFANWLHNDQPTGIQNLATTENGAYFLNGATSGATLLGVTRQADWKWAIASEDEWYKGAYYKGGSTNAGYWDYPTGSNSVSTDMANYDMSVGHTTDAGSYACSSPYGTFDQGGNLWEWNESVLYDWYRGLRGGGFGHHADSLLASIRKSHLSSNDENNISGFRVVQVPEPGSLLLLVLASMILTPQLSHRSRAA
jgi:formylglycine-generating enzyme